MNRRSILKGAAALVALALSPFKAKAGRLRVVATQFKCLGKGSFNEFLNTSYLQRMSLPVFNDEVDMQAAILRDRNSPSHVLGPDRRLYRCPILRSADRQVATLYNKANEGRLRKQIKQAFWQYRNGLQLDLFS